MSAKHTPGPWIAREDTNAMIGEDWMIGRENGKPDEVAVCSKRDAHLIAAAPALYVALETCARYMNKPANFTGTEFMAAFDAARAALAAARGDKE